MANVCYTQFPSIDQSLCKKSFDFFHNISLQKVVLTSSSGNSAPNCFTVSSAMKPHANWSKEFNQVVIIANLMVHFNRLGEIIASDITEWCYYHNDGEECLNVHVHFHLRLEKGNLQLTLSNRFKSFCASGIHCDRLFYFRGFHCLHRFKSNAHTWKGKYGRHI